MVVSEFYSSAIIVQRFIQDKQIISRLNSIVTALNASDSGLAKKRIAALMKELVFFEGETGFPVQGSAFLEYYGLQEVFSVAAWLQRDDQIGTMRVSALQRKVSSDAKTVQEANQLMTVAIKGLSTVVDKTKDQAVGFFKLPQDQVLLTLHFDGDDDAEFSKVTDKIKQLEKNLSLLSRMYIDPQAKIFRIVSLSKASPLVVDVALYSGVALTVNKIIKGVLDNVSKVQSIRKEEQKIKALKLSNERESIILAELKAELKDNAGSPAKLRDEIMSTIDEQTLDGSRTEIDKAVLEACKYFVKLLQTQARVQVHLNANNTPQQGAIDPGTALLNDRIFKHDHLRLLNKVDKGLQQGE